MKLHARHSEAKGLTMCGRLATAENIVPGHFDWDDGKVCGNCHRIADQHAIREARAEETEKREAIALALFGKRRRARRSHDVCLVPCPCCGETPLVVCGYHFWVDCANCVDGSEDAENIRGGGATREDAIENWNEMVDCYVDEMSARRERKRYQ